MKPWLKFEQQSFLTHYLEPVDLDASKWNKDMKEAERYNERFQRKQTWTDAFTACAYGKQGHFAIRLSSTSPPHRHLRYPACPVRQ